MLIRYEKNQQDPANKKERKDDYFLFLVSAHTAVLCGIVRSLLEGNCGGDPRAPPLVLQHKLPRKPVQLLHVSLLANPPPAEEQRLHVLLLQHFFGRAQQELHICRGWLRIHVHSAFPHRRRICLRLKRHRNSLMANYLKTSEKLNL